MRTLEQLKGNGCRYCEPGHPVTTIYSPVGNVKLCLECTMIWFPGRSIEWWESKHTPFLDHVEDAKRRAHEKQIKDGIEMVIGTSAIVTLTGR